MTAFWIICALLLVVAVLFVGVPLWRGTSRNNAVVRDAANLEIYRDGLSLILQQPEFAESPRAQRLVYALEAGNSMEQAFDEASTAGGVQIVIGGNDRWNEMQDVSLILARYGMTQTAVGVVGVLGPLRMPYGRAISTVRFVASVMDGLVEWIFK